LVGLWFLGVVMVNGAVAPFQGAGCWLAGTQGCGAVRLTLGWSSFAPLGRMSENPMAQPAEKGWGG